MNKTLDEYNLLAKKVEILNSEMILLQDENATLRDANKSANAAIGDIANECNEKCDQKDREIARLKEERNRAALKERQKYCDENAKLREKAVEFAHNFAWHLARCNIRSVEEPFCECGYSQALASLKEDK